MKRKFTIYWINYTKPTEVVHANVMDVLGEAVVFIEDNDLKAIYNIREIRKVLKEEG